MQALSLMLHLQAGWGAALLILAASPLAYYLVATLAAWRFFRRERVPVLPDYTPPVSLLKPVRGVDFGSYENFASFCRQDSRTRRARGRRSVPDAAGSRPP